MFWAIYIFTLVYDKLLLFLKTALNEINVKTTNLPCTHDICVDILINCHKISLSPEK